MNANVKSLEHAVEAMVAIRRFEETLLELFRQGQLMGTTHTCIGQEANAVGVAAALRPHDIVVSNHRCHGHFIAHVGDMAGLMAEIMGRAGGICGGWGGSQHLCVPGRFYSNGIQGGIMPFALGLALAQRLGGTDHAVAIFIGDGTLGQGAVYESLNMAACFGAPLLVIVEDNGIAQTTPTEATTAGTVPARAAAFGLDCIALEYPGPEEIEDAARTLLKAVRTGRPGVLALRSARLGPHSKGDDTRPEAVLKKLHAVDPLHVAAERLPVDRYQAMVRRADAAVAQAVRTAEDQPPATFVPTPPDTRPDAAGTPHADCPRSAAQLETLARRSLLDQVNDALADRLATDPTALLLGEDIADPYGGAFKATQGLSTRFPDRVLSTPISEESFVGLCGGLAASGYKPMAEVMFGDFLAVAGNQIINHLSLYGAMYNHQIASPVVVRAPMGGRRGYGPTHSQTLEKHFAGVNGLTVMAPSYLHPYAAMLARALRSTGPTLMVENKTSYPRRPEVTAPGMVEDFFYFTGADDDFLVALSLTGFEDEEASLVCYGGMVPVAMEAARQLLMKDEIAVRILAPGVLAPSNPYGLAAALAAKGPVVAIEECSSAYGFGSETAAGLLEAGALADRTFRRVGAVPTAIGAARRIETAVLPQVEDIVAAVRTALEG